MSNLTCVLLLETRKHISIKRLIHILSYTAGLYLKSFRPHAYLVSEPYPRQGSWLRITRLGTLRFFITFFFTIGYGR